MSSSRDRGTKYLQAVFGVLFTNVLFGIGLFAPSLTIEPRFGGMTSFVKLFEPSYGQPVHISVVSGIVKLYQHGDILLSIILAAFSIFVPLWKLGVLAAAAWRSYNNSHFEADFRLIEILGKLSLIDVFVLALLAVSIKALPGGSEVEIRWGLYVYSLAGFLLYLLPAQIKKLKLLTVDAD